MPERTYEVTFNPNRDGVKRKIPAVSPVVTAPSAKIAKALALATLPADDIKYYNAGKAVWLKEGTPAAESDAASAQPSGEGSGPPAGVDPSVDELSISVAEYEELARKNGKSTDLDAPTDRQLYSKADGCYYMLVDGLEYMTNLRPGDAVYLLGVTTTEQPEPVMVADIPYGPVDPKWLKIRDDESEINKYWITICIPGPGWYEAEVNGEKVIHYCDENNILTIAEATSTKVVKVEAPEWDGEFKPIFDKPEPGQHEQLDKLYTMGESTTEEIPPGAFEKVDPAPETDKQAEVTKVAKPNGTGSVDSVDQIEEPDLISSLLAEVNKQIEGLAIGERLILYDLPEAVYRPSTGFSTTNIKLGLTRSWRKMKAYMDGLAKDKKKQFSLGRSAHCKILQPSLYWDDFVVQPVNIGSRNSKAYKEWAATQGDKEILTEEQYQDTLQMEASIMAEAGEWFESGKSEVSGWLRISDNVVLKARADKLHDGLIIDLKTTENASYEGCCKAVRNYLYHLQSVIYCKVFGVPNFAFVFVESDVPYDCHFPFFIDGEKQEQAQQLLDRALVELEQCVETGVYPGYDNSQPKFVGLTGWERKQMENINEQ